MATVTDSYGIPEVFPELADLDLSSRITTDKYAIYYTARISQNQLNAALSTINRSTAISVVDDEDEAFDSDGHAQLAPHADFTGKHLRDVLEHHKDAIVANSNELADYDPLSIIVITDIDWRANGVLLISLHNVQASGRGYVFAFPHPADQAASVLVDIDVGNNSWEEACDAAGVDQPEPPAFMKVFEPSALDRWNVDEMGLIAWYALYQLWEPHSLTEALNGGPTSWDRPNGGIWSCPCHLSCRQNQVRESFTPDMGRDEKIAAVVVEHRSWVQKTRDANPGMKRYQEFHDRYIVISEHEGFEGHGVLVGEITGHGNDIVLERVAVANVVEVLVSKVQGDKAASALSEHS